MDSVRVCVVEVDAKRLTVGMFNQLHHVSCRPAPGEPLLGEALGWVNRKVGGCKTEQHLLWTVAGDVYDQLYVDCPHFDSEQSYRLHEVASTCAWSVVRDSELYAEALARRTSEGWAGMDRYQLARARDDLARTYVAQYRNEDPTLEPEVLNAIIREVSPLQEQQRMLEALPQLFVGR